MQEIAEAPRPARPPSCCPAPPSGLESSVCAIIAIAIAIGAALALGGGNLQFSLYLVALTGMGMLATTGVIVSRGHVRPGRATTPPASPRCPASSTASPSGSWSASTPSATPPRPSPRASPSARRSSPPSPCSPSYIETIGTELEHRQGRARTLFRDPLTQINVADPKTFIGLLIGGSVAVPVLRARHPRRRPHRRRRRAGGPQASSPTARS